ncbi:hypothetical protein [Xenorhabdus szentirmaii]|uniref:hypothetical protein n=1 Tax=Xenorhabdus szentirmaii TaxID=290112 RepID=UPI0011452AFE|nr:hypothetical protein [Xenorhabdus szentirmaii]
MANHETGVLAAALTTTANHANSDFTLNSEAISLTAPDNGRRQSEARQSRQSDQSREMTTGRT